MQSDIVLHRRVAGVRRRDDRRRCAGEPEQAERGYLGRAAVGVLFIAGGALLHVINLATGGDSAGFADPAHFAWVARAWNAVVRAQTTSLFIGLLAASRPPAGAGDERRAQDRIGYLAVIAFSSPCGCSVDRDQCSGSGHPFRRCCSCCGRSSCHAGRPDEEKAQRRCLAHRAPAPSRPRSRRTYCSAHGTAELGDGRPPTAKCAETPFGAAHTAPLTTGSAP